jgi:hypothetical protein
VPLSEAEARLSKSGAAGKAQPLPDVGNVVVTVDGECFLSRLLKGASMSAPAGYERQEHHNPERPSGGRSFPVAKLRTGEVWSPQPVSTFGD